MWNGYLFIDALIIVVAGPYAGFEGILLRRDALVVTLQLMVQHRKGPIVDVMVSHVRPLLIANGESASTRDLMTPRHQPTY
jgi:hypothetical protein